MSEERAVKPHPSKWLRRIVLVIILYVLSFVVAVAVIDGKRDFVWLEGPLLRGFYAPLTRLVNSLLGPG